jgi:hypothetical protein
MVKQNIKCLIAVIFLMLAFTLLANAGDQVSYQHNNFTKARQVAEYDSFAELEIGTSATYLKQLWKC